MSRIRRRTAAAVLAVAVAALGLSGCIALPEDPEPSMPCGALTTHPLPRCSQVEVLGSTSATFWQSQAVPGFDGGTYVVTDPAAMHDLDDVLGTRVTGDAVVTGECDGGRTTELTVDTARLGTITVVVDTCTDEALASDVDDLVAQWHADGVAQPVP
ncbi:hypothetical protein GCM10009846_05720 [Agrococcus versicolor]|uniref:DUF3558 domain-containing protein n=1 Tax=Agrococcus versicolor TaxID=501482 RepID=A0ABP5MFG7_9MICO